MIDIVFLGSGGSLPMPDRYLSSVLMRYQGRMILFDCGEGTQVSMKKIKCGLKNLDIILITHTHGDHIFGLPGLLSTIGNSERIEPITIIGPKGFKKTIESILDLIPYRPYEIKVIEGPGNFTFFNQLNISSLMLDHSAPCLGYRIDIKRNRVFDPKKAIENQIPKMIWSQLQKGECINHDGITYHPNQVLGEERKGLVISYITDTRPTESIIEFVRNSDLLISEGTYGNNEDIEKAIRNKHMTFSEAATFASAGNVNELILTHFSPAMPQPELFYTNATSIFPNTILATDYLQKTYKFRE